MAQKGVDKLQNMLISSFLEVSALTRYKTVSQI